MAYYRARAPEYDRVYAEREDLRELLTVVDDLPIAGDVLELACGTGQWTGALATRARSVTAVDASPEVLGRP
jgi:demethylmenaquinone methyltransferase/2-methoxy-6-polyprenyl-1,4-benzoquinol methylase